MIEILKAVLEAIGAARWFFRKRRRELLVIDDDTSARFLMREMIEAAGYKCKTASTAEAGLALAQQEVFPIIYVDSRLPLMSGFDFLNEIIQVQPKSLTIIVCGLASDLGRIPPGRFVGVILKPPTLQAIEDSIRKTKM
jgi:DNA-binding NtrC family response regulator